MFITMALAELGSAAPTSGGLYYWSHKYAPPGWKNFLSWLCACKLSRSTLLAIAEEEDMQIQIPWATSLVWRRRTGGAPCS